jgi:hypothetical protein
MKMDGKLLIHFQVNEGAKTTFSFVVSMRSEKNENFFMKNSEESLKHKLEGKIILALRSA